MFFYLDPFFGREFARLSQDIRMNMDLSDVMQGGLNTHSIDKFIRHPEALGN
jgi:hypothetical protein